jgi:DNA-binding LytR/AlgR family response regulator
MLYGEDKVTGDIKGIKISDIGMITMRNKIPIITTIDGDQFALVTKFNQLSKLLGEKYNFLLTDRGILVNNIHITQVDKERKILIINDNKDIYATVSENRRHLFFEKHEEVY